MGRFVLPNAIYAGSRFPIRYIRGSRDIAGRHETFSESQQGNDHRGELCLFYINYQYFILKFFTNRLF